MWCNALALVLPVLLAAQTARVPPITFQGRLKLITGREIVIVAENDQTISIRRTRKTKFLRGGKEIKPSDIAPGAPLTVDVVEARDLKPEAVGVIAEK